MHPSPDALTRYTDAELNEYRRELDRLIARNGDDNGAYTERQRLIDAILTDRKGSQ